MINKIKNAIFIIQNIQLSSFFYLNYFCKSVIRIDNSKIIPYKHCAIEIASDAKIYIAGGDIEVGCDRINGSKAETRVRLRNKSVWSSQGGCRLSYGGTIEVLENGILNNKFFTMNSNSVLVSAKNITIGQDVMIARNVVIYDSDFHSVLDQDGNVSNESKPVVLGDHVWLGTNVMVLKGSIIGNGSIISANTLVRESVSANMVYSLNNNYIKRINNGGWSRKKP